MESLRIRLQVRTLARRACGSIQRVFQLLKGCPGNHKPNGVKCKGFVSWTQTAAAMLLFRSRESKEAGKRSGLDADTKGMQGNCEGRQAGDGVCPDSKTLSTTLSLSPAIISNGASFTSINLQVVPLCNLQSAQQMYAVL
jgi:hypothetical protein